MHNPPEATPPSAPLAGLRILDFSQLIAGPAATSMLAALGASVIKIEPPTGDPMRNLSAAENDHPESSGSFQAYNVGKQSVVIDLKSEEGLRDALALCEEADAIVEAFRPGVLARLGVDLAELRSRRPELVCVSISAFGSASPQATRGGVDIVMQGETGFMSATGTPDTGPLKAGAPIIDATTGYIAALAIVTGLLQSARTGVGAAIDVPMFDVGVHLQSQAFAEFVLTGTPPVRCGNRAPYAAPAGVYSAADGDIVVSAHLPRHWQVLCAVLGLEDLLDDPRFAFVEARVLNREALDEKLAAAFATRSAQDWIDELTSRGLTIGRVSSYADIVASPQVAETHLLRAVRTDSGRATSLVRPPLIGSGWMLPADASTPALGEHTDIVLSALRSSAGAAHE